MLGAPLVLLIVGIVLLVLAYTLTMPPPLRSLCMVGGVVLIVASALVLLFGLLGLPLSGTLGAAVAMLVIGVALVCLAYYVVMPPPLHTLCMVIGVILIAVGAILLLLGLLGVPLTVGGRPGMILMGP